MSVAKTIADQIGSKTLFMIGAKRLVGMDDSLTFNVGRNAKKVTHIRITLDTGADLYNCEAFKIRGTKVESVMKRDGVFCDGLHEFIADATGMVTNL